MATSNSCTGFLSHLETWIEGERPVDAKAHLRDCASCQAIVADLNAIETEARSWSALESEAPERVWMSLRAQLEQEGLIHSADADRVVVAAVAPSHADWLRGLFNRIPRPALAGAYLSVLVALGFALSGPANRESNQARWLRGTEVETSPLSAKLNSFEQNPLASRDLNPAVTASLQQNLAIVDNYISLCEKSVQEEPENEVARDYLYEAYQQKADLLAQIGERGGKRPMSTSHFHTLANHTMRWKTATLLVPGLLVCSAVSAGPVRHEQHFKVAAHPVITIHNPDGLITVKAWTKAEVMVISMPASTAVEVDAEQMGNRVDVSTRALSDSVAPGDMKADFQINVPEDAELQIHNDTGSVNVSNVTGDMNVETVAAGVDLEDTTGYLTVKTVGGSFQCLRCAGRIEVSSITGSFKLIDLKSTHVWAQTSQGNILFNGQFLPNGTYSLKNYSGVIEVRFSPEDSFDMSATSLKGKVINEAKLTPSTHEHHFMPRWGNALFGTFNQGRAKVELTSFDGTINILKRD